MKFNSLIPELTVGNINKSKAFYVDTLGFTLEYERPEDKFAFVSFGKAQFMLEQLHTNGWNTAELEYPFGRGINFSIEVSDIDALYHKLLDANYPLFRSLKCTSYKANGEILNQKEFLVQDTDGYLLRFTQE